MKKTIYSILGVAAIAMTIASCGGETIDGAALSKEVCDCYTEANRMKVDPVVKTEEQDKCADLQTDNWDKVKGDKEREDAFNDAFPCGV